MAEPEGQVAGRLSVIVTASLAGFRREVKRKVEAAAKGIEAEVGVKLDTKKLRKDLQAKVAEASEGVKATIGVDLDAGTLRARVEAAAKAAASETTVTVNADTDTAEAQTETFLQRLRNRFGRRSGRVEVPIDGDDKGVTRDALRARAEAQAAVDGAGGVAVPVKLTGLEAKAFRARGLIRGGAIFGIVSLLEPAVGVIGQIVAGLTAMSGAAAPVVGQLSAIPIAIQGGLQAMGTGKLIAQGFGDALKLVDQELAALGRGEKLTEAQQEKLNQALKELSPSAREAVIEVAGLRKEFVEMRKGVQEEFFSRVVGDLRPLAKTWLPLLRKELGGTAAVMGDAAHATAEWAQTRDAQSDTGKVMANNNIILGDFLYMVGQFGQGSLDFLVASRRYARGAGDTMRDIGDWFAGKMAAGRKSGGIEDFLDRANAKGSQLLHITKQIGGGLYGIFHAGVPTGDSLLTQFDDFVTNWNKWVNSAEGQEYLQDWFEGTREGFVEAAQLIDDAFKGAAKWAADPKIAGLLHQIRTELGPALGDFLKNLSDDAAPGVIDFLTQLTRTLKHLEPAIEIVSQVTNVLTGLLEVLNDLADASPETSNAVAKILGGLLLLGSVGRLGKLGAVLTGAKVAGKGGLLARLFGGGAEAAAVAGGVGAAATNAGKLSKAMGPLARFAKMPLLKKAGWIGLILGGVDAASALTDARNFGKDFSTSLVDGYVQGLRSPQAKAAFTTAFANLLGQGDKSADAGDVLFGGGKTTAEDFDKFGIDVKRLASELQTLGSKSPYLRQVKEQLNGISNSWKHGPWADMTSWVPKYDSEGEQARDLLHFLDTAADGVDDAIEKAKELNRRKQVLRTLLAHPEDVIKISMPKAEKPKGAPWWLPEVPVPQRPKQVIDTFRQQPPLPAPKVPMRPGVLGQFKSPKVPPPDIKKWRDTFLNNLPQVVRQGVGKVKAATQHLKDPFTKGAIGFDKATRQAKQWGNETAQSAKRATQAVRNSAKATERAARQQGQAFDSIPKKARRAVDRTKDAAGDLTRAWGNKTKDLAKVTDRAMDGVVKAVRSAKAPAKNASTQVGSGVKQPLSGLAGPLQAAGGHAMDGFAAGIRAAGARAVAEARAVAAQVEAATRQALDIRSPSRVMKKLGAWVSQGFANGIKGGLKAVQRVQHGLWERLTDRKFSAERIRAMKARFADEFKAIEAAAKKRDLIKDRLDRAENRLARLRGEKATFKSTVKNAAEEFGDIGSIAQANGGFANVSWLIGELKDRAKKSKTFRRIINRLRRKGLSKQAIQQIVDLGMEDGLPVAQQLVQGSDKEIKRINRLQGIIRDQAKKLGQETSKAFWNSGIKSAQALVHQLKSRQRDLNKIAKHMADALVKQLRSALGLPTKKKGDKKDGGDSSSKRTRPPAGGAGGALRTAGARSGGGVNITSRGPDGPPRRPPYDGPTPPPGPGAAPMIETVHFHGVSDERSAEKVFSELEWTLRKLRGGGLHADRVA